MKLLPPPFRGGYVLLMVIPARSVVCGAVRAVVEEGWTGHRLHSSSKTISLVSNSTAGANIAISNNDLLTIITVTLDWISLL